MPHNNPTQPQQAVSKANYTDDEIDLFELLEDVKNKWRWVVASFVACTAVAVIYALLAQPVYKTELIYRPVTFADLYQLNQPKLKEALNLIDSGERNLITPEVAYNEFRARISSSSNLRGFYTYLLLNSSDALRELLTKDN